MFTLLLRVFPFLLFLLGAKDTLALEVVSDLRLANHIDQVPANVSLFTLSPEYVAKFLAHEDSVNILTRCFVRPSQCTSASSKNFMSQINLIEYVVKEFKPCTPKPRESLYHLLFMLFRGLTTQYPEQWKYIIPKVPNILSYLKQSS